MKRRRVLRWVLPLCLLGVVVLFPWVVSNSYVRFLMVVAMLFAVVASSWDLTLGYAGIFNFAHVAAFAMGAYASAIAVARLNWSPWVGMAVGIIVAVLIAVLAFIPAIRLRGVYVALTTFAFAQICQFLVESQVPITGGSQGIVGLAGLELFGYPFRRDGGVAYYYAALALLVISVFALRRIARGRLGLTLVASRDSEHYALSRGVNVARQQLLAFCVSGACAGAAGAFYSSYFGVVSPSLFSFDFTTLFLSMIWFGGVATIFGPLVGAVILTFVGNFLSPFGPIEYIALSALIIATLLFLPGGVWPYLGRWSRPAPPAAGAAGTGRNDSQSAGGEVPRAAPAP